MPVSQAVTQDYEIIKYLQLSLVPQCSQPDPFSFIRFENTRLHDALDTQVQLLCLRLGVHSAFAALIGDDRPYFLVAATSKQQLGSLKSASCLGTDNDDLQRWHLILKQAIATNAASDASKGPVSVIASLGEDDRSAKLPSVVGPPHFSFYAATPIVSKLGVSIGAVFILDNDTSRRNINNEERALLASTARICMDQLEAARKHAHQQRWERMNDQLTRFVGSSSIRDQQLEEPPRIGRSHQEERRKEEIGGVKDLALHYGRDPSKAKLPEDALRKEPETSRELRAEAERAKRIVRADEKHNARALTGQAGRDGHRNSDAPGETTYRKIFRRAAECLQEALQVDGVLFTDGLIGYHGPTQSIGQLEEELQHEMFQRPHREESVSGKALYEEGSSKLFNPQHRDAFGIEGENAATRTYTSPEYMRGIHVERPAEILGMCVLDSANDPRVKRLNQTTVGLTNLDEGHLQLLMDRYPEGKVWYRHETTKVCYRVENDTLIEDKSEETRRLAEAVPLARQILFQPLTEPVSLKRLAGCIAWSTQKFPVLTDIMDLRAIRGFLHVVESEISRLDASASVKQKEAFVSSVSHELRTPLHGILGSVQLLADTPLDSFQSGLADTIKKSGSTLNETLTSVLSYAKINQFERQQHKYRQRRPPDTKWSLPDKVLASGPDTDFEGLYMCTNVAMLCEEVAGVLEAGKSYDNPENNRGVNVVLNIDYGENWNFYTEPGALRRTAINIIGNALKYTTEGSVTITLTASEIDTGDVPLAGDKTTRRRIVTLSVKDTGKGMSKEFIHKHLFVPFTQEDVTSSDGVGLGMSIVKSLVSLLAGEIRVESQQGVGTEVTVTMPMRQVDPDRSDPGKPALELEQSIEALRREHLSAVLFGFPDVIRRGLENYLREWFHCNILEAVDDAKPDVVLVDEGNEAVAKDVERTAERYGRLGILLSIATAPENLSKPMVPIQGYRMFERVRRPIGPYSLAKALSACVEKLRSRSHRQQEEQEHKGHSPEIHDQEEGLQPGNRDPAKEDSSNTTKSQVAQPPGEEDTAQASTRASIERPPPTRSSSSFSIATHYVDEADPSTLRILVVEDNIVNRRLLGAFLKRYGCKNLTNAENGAVAVKEVEACTRNFDVILMDLSMPVMDGFQATREIRRLEGERASLDRAYIIALTGLASDRNEEDALAAGVDKFITKPVQFKQLAEVLKKRESPGLSERGA